jgi:hypothetical protein
MAETNIKISLELADKAAQAALSDFLKKADAGDKSLKKLKDSGKSTFEEIAVHIGKTTGIFDIFAGNLAANLVTKAFDQMVSAASALFNIFVVDGVKAASAQEDAVNSLNIALAQTGKYTAESSEDFQDYANTLQATTKFEDDLILKNAALIQSFANLDQAGLKRATAAALDLSSALDKDLGSVSEALAKAATGNVTPLQKMGLEIRKGTTDAQTFANALAAVEERFGGAAAAKVNTFSGAVAVATNAFGDFQEELGNIIVKNPVVIAVIKEAAKIFTELSAATKANNSSFTALVGGGISTFLNVSAFLVSFLDVVVRSFQVLYGVVQALSLPFIALTVPIRALSVGMAQAVEEANKFAGQAADNLQAFGEKGDGALSEVATNLLRMKEAADQGMFALANGAKTTVEPLNNTKGKVAELTDEAKRAEEQLKSFALELVKQSTDTKAS